MADPSPLSVGSNVASSTIPNGIISEATTILNNLTASILEGSTNSSVDSHFDNSTGVLQQSFLPDVDDGHKTPVNYFSTVIIICMGLAILIVPVFCFVGFVCARSKVFTAVREAAGKGWGFADADVPYTEFGDDYIKDKSPSSADKKCDVKILVADDNCVPSTSELTIDPIHVHNGGRSGRRGSFFRANTDSDEDISSLPPTFVCNAPA
ncbi:hypothetical protein Ocin01_13175 [Orchesella cincta]|uniref:Uncharacterized protein n=1 Tax=Orchesella cincta TaxID=48709 RepID=A0A1D2MKJ3_ORCCI|nr:hypothetical protein Ocin01_13175 [Orchesella cincta]